MENTQNFRLPYQEQVRVQTVFTGPSLTKQSFSAECNINTIMKRYQKTGLIDHVARYQGQYGDFVTQEDYHTAMNRVIEANEAFMSLPSSLRTRFRNDPAAFLDFVQNPENLDEMKEMGLLKGVSEPVNEPPATEDATAAEEVAEQVNAT